MGLQGFLVGKGIREGGRKVSRFATWRAFRMGPDGSPRSFAGFEEVMSYYTE